METIIKENILPLIKGAVMMGAGFLLGVMGVKIISFEFWMVILTLAFIMLWIGKED